MADRRGVLLAIGGNAISQAGELGTAEEQARNIDRMSDDIVDLAGSGEPIVIVHGNGPQVGIDLRKQELSKPHVPSFPLDLLTAESQGALGYLLARGLRNRLRRTGHGREISVLLTQAVVDPQDPAFGKPTKPIGQFFSKTEIDALNGIDGMHFVEDSGRGYRRVVPSPRPRQLLETKAIRLLLDAGHLVIAAGGGGIPVYRDASGDWTGIEAVIDKDFASAMLAAETGLARLVLLTGVARVALNYGTPNQSDLDRMNTAEAERHLQEGQFPPGSMGPKIEAAIDFVRRGGEEAIITSIDQMSAAIAGKTGTRIIA